MTRRFVGVLYAAGRILTLTALLYLLAATAGLPGRPDSPETAVAQEAATPLRDLLDDFHPALGPPGL